jgi:hypothetical protein
VSGTCLLPVSTFTVERLEHPPQRDLPIGLAQKSANLAPVGLAIHPQRHPALVSRVRGGEKALMLQQFLLALKTSFRPRLHLPSTPPKAANIFLPARKVGCPQACTSQASGKARQMSRILFSALS